MKSRKKRSDFLWQGAYLQGIHTDPGTILSRSSMEGSSKNDKINSNQERK